jgi:hypothetical protein
MDDDDAIGAEADLGRSSGEGARVLVEADEVRVGVMSTASSN